MEKLAKPSIVKKFLVAMLTIAALSGAVSRPTRAPQRRTGVGGSPATPTTANKLNLAAGAAYGAVATIISIIEANCSAQSPDGERRLDRLHGPAD